MTKTLTRIFTIALLTMVSMSAWADIDVQIANDGVFTGGTIKYKEQTKPDEKGFVTVTITVTPDKEKGYTISKNDIIVVSTYPPSGLNSGTRTPEIAEALTLYYNGSEKEDIKDLSAERYYTFKVSSGFGAWVKEATFSSDSKGGGKKRGTPTPITSLSQITDADGDYAITQNIFGGTAGVSTFNGTLEANIDPTTNMPYRISGLSTPLFTTLTGIVNNLVLEDVNISGHSGNTGAIACTANGSARIYNVGILSGSVGGTAYTGGLVGFLDGSARVINCYSFADITGGSEKGGIVGYNNVASTQSSLTTMVMNCMFYGDIVDGSTIAPIYGGKEINNVSGGMNNYNYYRYRSRYSKEKKITKYNRALAMEEKFITRFERYRLLLNSNKNLAAKYASTDAVTVNHDDMLKWVLETADRTIAEPKPYPVLKAKGKYPSIINYDAKNAPDSASVGRSKGGKLGSKTLAVTILTKSQKTTGGQSWPTATASDVQETSLTLYRTDKDFDRFNYNYDKVQLPYYNDIGTGNYTENRVVTGWKITNITGGTPGTFTESDSWGGYNFADRHCTNKDLYTSSGRVFSQGAYWDVPEGVTAITIEPYWAIANYVSDGTYDVIYNKDYAAQTFSLFGTQYSNKSDIDIHGDGNNQKVYTTINNALAGFINTNKTVYDQAVVLVGNVHQSGNPTNSANPYTLMSIDLNHDNEPDYSYIFGHNNRQAISPIRYDFINIMGIAEAQMPKEASAFRNVSIFNLMGWFETTNTCVVNFSQFEYDNSVKTAKSAAPLILLGGSFEQFVSTQSTTLNYTNKKTQYIHVGGNAWFAKFGNGTHSDGDKFTPHVPISVSGGDYDEFYLSGTYQPNITNMQSDNAECYISGGRFGEMAGASLEAIQGDVQWQIDWADITNFYGGGVNANNPITGEIKVDITRSHVGRYCGGPKFGDMSTDKDVTTNAKDCEFDTFFGAGYGGNSYNRVKYRDEENGEPKNYQGLYTSDRGKYYDGVTTNAYSSKPAYGKKGNGVATDFDYEYFIWSTGKTGARFYVQFVSFSLARTNDVTTNLKGCTINENFYGGGSLGKVNGTATSTLDACTVKGNVFGGGYSATLPKVEVRNTPAFVSGKEPSKNANIGMFEEGEIADVVNYEWKHVDALPANGNSGMESTSDGNFVYTDEDLNTLGQVKNSHVTIKGTTEVIGDVYGGGALASMDESGETMVSLIGGTINGNVYGGGQGRLPGTKDENGKDLPEVEALVGDANVELNKDVPEGGCIVKGNIFGCNNLNGTPKGNATVHIYRTNGDELTDGEDLESIDDTKHKYHLNAVYGGGNLAAYIPTANDAKASVIIDGCDATSIRTVYGGGNAASTPATSVVVNGTYEIEEVFGGGNGKDALPDGSDNPGANVGFKNYSAEEDTYNTKELRQSAEFVNQYVYGSGQANVTIVGGRIHRVFGGSNTKGNVRITAVTMLDDQGGCHFMVDEAYGGGKSAPMDGEAKLLMSCIPGLKVAYGGAENANILGDVTLNITNGNFDRVFGGNNISGTIGGKITVNIEETGCSPIIIGQLYGGGNQAPYDANGQTGPTLNIKSFTSIGEVYGGGYGISATVTGDTHVNINEVKGRYTAGTHNYGTAENPIGVNTKTGNRTISFSEFVRNKNGDYLDADGNVTTDESERAIVDKTVNVFIPVFTANKIGGIGMVYGGGNEAEVVGNTHVNIGNLSSINFVTGVDNAAPEENVSVEGADIRGNVYGGGNAAEVTGNTNVVIGKQSDTSVTP